MYKLKRAGDNVIDNMNDILPEFNSYYANLYHQSKCFKSASDKLKQDVMPKESYVKLSQEHQDSCQGIVTNQTLTEALKYTKTNKSPGLDGISYELIKYFGIKLVTKTASIT